MTLRNLRIHASGEAGPRAGGEFVLYWMQMTQRAHENFALDFAIERANELGIPVVAVFRLRHDYPWASDRFHTFVLQAMAGMGDAMERRGVSWALAVQATDEPTLETQRFPAPLDRLARRAALVVTDFYPTFIAPRQLRDLRRLTDTPILAVDSCTIVPMGYHDKAHRSARGIRPILLEALPHFLSPAHEPIARTVRPIDPGFDAVTVPASDIADYVAGCPIDHSVEAVTTFAGGTAPARQRLERWLATGLPRYLDEQGDPNSDATSRLSPWLHFGHLSPHEVLRAALEAGPTLQYEKFRDELLTWRELAYNFTYFDPGHRTIDATPEWARKELAEHESDLRDPRYSEDELERGLTDSALWNASQLTYVRDGWMHNYLRMLWGKAILGWTPDAAAALALMEHFNNKYSLDGRDPNTYAGIHWILGKFDRPFFRRPIFGTVRYMSLVAAERKFDVPRYVRSQLEGLGV